MDYQDFARKVPVDKCPICGAPREKLWLKDIQVHGNGKCAVLYKCSNCAYVNTTRRVEFYYDTGEIPHYIEYHIFGREGDKVYGYTLDGEKHEITEEYPLFGRDFHGIPPEQRDIKCPHCGEPMALSHWNPFIRPTVGQQYRCDVFYRCPNGHQIAFGVHITPEDFDLLNVCRR